MTHVIALEDGQSSQWTSELINPVQIYHNYHSLIFTGVKDPSTVNQDISLGELGLDSLMGVEVKQALERIANTDLPIKAIRQLNFKRLCEMESNVGVNSDKTEIKE